MATEGEADEMRENLGCAPVGQIGTRKKRGIKMMSSCLKRDSPTR